jgi:hypothetical protein
VKSVLLSMLTGRFTDAAALASAHPHDWVIWEPGTWKPPGTSTVAFMAKSPPAPQGKQALALALLGEERVTLGRAETCDLVINDGTLSSAHLVFTRQGPAWFVEDAGSRNGTAVDGLQRPAHVRVKLMNGSSIAAAQVNLTFHTAQGLFARL